MTNENQLNTTNQINTETQELLNTNLAPNPQKQRPYSSTNIPLVFEEDDNIDAIMEQYYNLSDEEQLQTKRELCEYYGDKLETEHTTHNIHTPEFIYSTGNKQKDEEKIQNIISKSAGSLAKNPNHTISIEEFKRRFKLEREAHKEFYGSNPYINAMHDAFIKASILNRVLYTEQYNTPEALEAANILGYKPAYETPNLQPKQYAQNSLSPTLTDGVTDKEIRQKKKEIVLSDKDMYNSIMYFENIKNFPYIDSENNITAGVGFNINQKKDFINQPWQIVENGIYRKAKLSEIEDAYNRLLNMTKNKKNNHSADFFAKKTNLRLPPEYISNEYNKKLDEKFDYIFQTIEMYNQNTKKFSKSKTIYHKITNPDSIPINFLIGLMDLSYNVKNFYKFKKMWNAIATNNYKLAIIEAKRSNPNNNEHIKKRNDWVEKRMRENKYETDL